MSAFSSNQPSTNINIGHASVVNFSFAGTPDDFQTRPWGSRSVTYTAPSSSAAWGPCSPFAFTPSMTSSYPEYAAAIGAMPDHPGSFSPQATSSQVQSSSSEQQIVDLTQDLDVVDAADVLCSYKHSSRVADDVKSEAAHKETQPAPAPISKSRKRVSKIKPGPASSTKRNKKTASDYSQKYTKKFFETFYPIGTRIAYREKEGNRKEATIRGIPNNGKILVSNNNQPIDISTLKPILKNGDLALVLDKEDSAKLHYLAKITNLNRGQITGTWVDFDLPFTVNVQNADAIYRIIPITAEKVQTLASKQITCTITKEDDSEEKVSGPGYQI